ncbi:MAG: acyl carrier protein [Paracoccaceae bacterium]|jgi:acyl carrier protein
MSTEAEIRIIITEVVEGFDGDQLSRDTEFMDSGLDSLDMASVMLEVQEKYDVVIAPGDEDKYDTLTKLVAYIEANKDA